MRTLKHWFTDIVRRIMKKEYCNACAQELTEIRGRYPGEPRRKVCACCATEYIESLDEQNRIGPPKSNEGNPQTK